jgi:hypothetical protein
VVIIIVLAVSGVVETEGTAQWNSTTNEAEGAAIGIAPARNGYDPNGRARPKW